MFSLVRLFRNNFAFNSRRKCKKREFFTKYFNAFSNSNHNFTKLRNNTTSSSNQSFTLFVGWNHLVYRILPLSICCYAYFRFKRLQNETNSSNWKVNCYRVLPLRTVSRVWGWLADLTIPYYFRPLIFGVYSFCFGVKIDEAKDSNLCSYRSLCDFFTRQLKENIRPLANSCLVSPADGTVVHFGRITSDFIEQVKGVTYSLNDFLGETRFDYHKNRQLFHCVIYLAPGDYHRFHSPTNWKPTIRKHFTGDLLSVNPKVISWCSGLFCLNERVLYAGSWKFGYFAYTLVGATNVGKINVYFDVNLKTNKNKKKHATINEQEFSNLKLNKGDLIGEFRMGSTIVLIFEAPDDFEFSIKVGDKIKFGQSIGHNITKNLTFLDKIQNEISIIRSRHV